MSCGEILICFFRLYLVLVCRRLGCGRFRVSGKSFSTDGRLVSLMGATGKVFVRRAFADLKLSLSAASWADFWMVSGFSRNCLLDLLTIFRLSS